MFGHNHLCTVEYFPTTKKLRALQIPGLALELAVQYLSASTVC